MPTAKFVEMRQAYERLAARFRAGKLSESQYRQALQSLRWRDESGIWWAIRPSDGRFLRYDGRSWVPASPPSPGGPITVKSSTSVGGNATATTSRSPLRALVPFAGLILSSSCGVLWGLYTLLRLGQGERADLLTPILAIGFTFALWIFQRPLAAVMTPLTSVLRPLPRPLLLGAAMALPVLTGLVCASLTTSGYGAMRWSVVISMVGAYVLTYRPKEEP